MTDSERQTMTNREIAKKLWDIAQAMREAEMPMPDQIEEVADALYSPKPEPEPGMVVWWRYRQSSDAEYKRIGIVDGVAEGIVDKEQEFYDWEDIEWKPARILADDEVAGAPDELIHRNGKTYKILELPPVSEWRYKCHSVFIRIEKPDGSALCPPTRITCAEAEGREG